MVLGYDERDQQDEPFVFLIGGGEAARIIKAFDWGATSLGPIEGWPQSLKTTCSLILRSPVPIVTLWGEDGVMIYNDAYSVFAGSRHPQLFGSKVREGWPEVADFNDNVMKVGLAGGTLAYADQELTLHRRDGKPEQVWMNLDYSPVLGEDGRPAGVMAIVVETTANVKVEARLKNEGERLRLMFEQAPGFVATTIGPDHVIGMANKAYLQLVDNRDIIGKPIREALPEVEEQGFVSLLDRVLSTRRPYVGRAVRILLQRHNAPPDERYLDFIYQPIFGDDGKTTGIFVQGHDVTEQRLAEDALRESEARFRLVADNAPVMLWMSDESGKCLYLNSALRAFWGVEPDAVEGFDWTGTVHEGDRQALEQASSDAMLRQVPFSVEARYRRKKGGYRLLRTEAQPRFGSNGEFLGMIGVNTDITERRAEEVRRVALIELSDRFRELTDPTDIAFAAAEMLGRLHEVSRAGYGTIDLTAETITIERDWNAPGVNTIAGVLNFREYGTYIDDLKRGETVVVTDAEQDPRTRATAEALKAIKARAFINMPVTEKAGLVALLYLNHATERPWSNSELAFIRDVSERTRIAVERRRAEQELEQVANSLERQVSERTAEVNRLWRNSRDLLVVLADDGAIRSVNPAWSTVLGFAARDSVGRNFSSFVWSTDAAPMPINHRRADSVDQDVLFRHLDGSPRWISWRIFAEEGLTFAYGRDITAEKEQAIALVQAEEQLRQSQKMEAIGQLTGGVAHDFNNLLQVVSGNLQLLTKDVAGNERAERRIASALAGVGRGSKLANQLLAFGRRQALEPKVVNIGRFIAGLEDMLRRTIGEAIEIETIRSSGLWNTFVDPTRIENAILNLAINARDAMGGIGKLTIEAGNAFIDDAYVQKHPGLAPGQYVLLAVTDTGHGMTADVIEKAFDPFFSTKPVDKGSGLGLSMVYGFVKQSGGHIKIYSEPGEGTTVRIYLPRSMEQEDRLVELDFGPITGGIETILLAEDDEDVRATVVEMLGDLGYRVLKARDASAALTIIESGVPIDLLFTDVVMPGPLRSADLARKAKERLPQLAVLFTSGYTENSIVHDGRLDAGIDLLSKPYSREALARKVRQVLNARQQLNRQSDGAGTEAASATRTPPGQKPLKVLLVEDDFLIRLNTADLLQELGHQVTEAATGEEGWALVGKQTFELLVTDMTLPGMSGADLAAKTRELHPDMAVIFATGLDKLPEIPGGRLPVLLRKPFDTVDIKAAIREALK